jgi:hypothetical protein
MVMKKRRNNRVCRVYLVPSSPSSALAA